MLAPTPHGVWRHFSLFGHYSHMTQTISSQGCHPFPYCLEQHIGIPFGSLTQ